jgi:hypothetical protein
MGRRHRFIAAQLTIAALLFAQGAVAAHASAMATAPAQPAMDMPCDHEGSGKPNLCVSHCDFGNASVDSAKAAPAMPQLVQSALRVPSLVALAAPRQVLLERRPPPEPEPPPTRFVVLRI